MEYISPEELQVCITYLKSNPKIKRNPNPVYELEALLCLSILESDADFLTNIALIDPEMPVEEMSVDNIRTILTLIESLENEQKGILAQNIENGYLLQLMLRLQALTQ